MLVALVAGTVLTTLTGCGIRIVKHESFDEYVVGEKFTSVRARSDSGDVTIRYQQGLTETKLRRKAEYTKDTKPTGPTHRVEGTSLVLDSCGDDCDANYEVFVPSPDITVVGNVGSGDVTIEGLASVDFETGSGEIVLLDIAGDVKANSGSGDLRATRIGGTLTADLGSGRIELNTVGGKVFALTRSGRVEGTALSGDVVADASSGRVELTLAEPRSVRVNAGSGDVTVRVPGGPYKITGTSGSGDREIHVPTDPAAALELNLTTGSGEVRVYAI
ncbi:Putative adhesin [Lentzea fradiae]|uniref:Putative adhesin n=1 Tax=Lentzea fradiae TaxID=200378 RepID=A0A1G7M6T7_9PSEU|nr:Putative adhesin [Lentzea fradiae]